MESKIEICEKIKKSIRKLVLFNGDIPVSQGTAVVVNDSGTLLTANHVIDDYPRLDNPKIMAYGLYDMLSMEYNPILYNVSIDISQPNFFKQLPIDLAILNPREAADKVDWIEPEEKILPEGTDVIMAGFPDEIHPPLNFINLMLNYENPELSKYREQIEKFMKAYVKIIMIKSGMIGSTQKIVLNCRHKIQGVEKSIFTEGAEYWIDNASNHGASGGPIVNTSGKLVGIICEKGVTTHEVLQDIYFKVPSGATMGLSHKLITWALNN